MSLAPGHPFTLILRAPWRSLQVALGACLACVAGALALAMPAPWQAGPSTAGQLVLSAEAGDLPAVGAGQLDRLRAAIPDVPVGGAQWVEVRELAPPVLPVSELVVVGAEPAWPALAGFELSDGRGLSAEDARAASPVCLVSQRLAHALDASASPAGLHLRVDQTWLTVVGVLAATDPAQPAPDLVLPLRASTRRLGAEAAAGVDELRVGLPADDPLGRRLVRRVLSGDASSASDPSGGDVDPDAAPLRALRGALGLALAALVAAGLLLQGLGLPAVLGPSARRGLRGAASGGLCSLLLASPGMLAGLPLVGVLVEGAALAPVGCCGPGLALILPVVLGAVVGGISPRAPAS